MSNVIIRPEDFQVGTQLSTMTFGPVTSEHLVRWVAASEDFHAIHYDKDFAIQQGLPGVVMQGPFKLALIERQLLDMFGKQAKLMSLSCTYRATDVLGAQLVFKPKVVGIETADDKRRVTIEIRGENEKGVLTVEGKAVMALEA